MCLRFIVFPTVLQVGGAYTVCISEHLHTVIGCTVILTDQVFFFFYSHDGWFPLSSSGFEPLFLVLLYENGEPPGTVLPPLIHQVLNLQ